METQKVLFTTIKGEDRQTLIRLNQITNGNNLSLKDLAEGEKLECTGIVQFNNPYTDKKTAEVIEENLITAILTKDGKTFATNSKVVKKTIDNLVSSLGEFISTIDNEPLIFEIYKGKSEKGTFTDFRVLG